MWVCVQTIKGLAQELQAQCNLYKAKAEWCVLLQVWGSMVLDLWTVCVYLGYSQTGICNWFKWCQWSSVSFKARADKTLVCTGTYFANNEWALHSYKGYLLVFRSPCSVPSDDITTTVTSYLLPVWTTDLRQWVSNLYSLSCMATEDKSCTKICLFKSCIPVLKATTSCCLIALPTWD